MNKSELNPDPDLSTPTIPVICDQCRAHGMAGDERFAGIPDILDFEPVQRRAHANGWTAEHQRAFVAALAITGSARQAARAIGRHAFGAEQLRKAKGGRSFGAACDAAMDIARERERERIHGNLKELADSAADDPSPLAGGPDHDDPEAPRRELEEVRGRIARRIERARRQYLREIAPDPEKRRAYEALNGDEDVDWDHIERWSLSEPGDDREEEGKNEGYSR